MAPAASLRAKSPFGFSNDIQSSVALSLSVADRFKPTLI
jgi:hypothetical protein